MAKHGQQKQESSANDAQSKSGGRQAVVELWEVSTRGLVFWTRHRFDIGAEVQVRIHRSTLPAALQNDAGKTEEWVTLKGLVVECPGRRREDGSSGFQVSLLIEDMAAACAGKPTVRSTMRWIETPLPWMSRFGLN